MRFALSIRSSRPAVPTSSWRLPAGSDVLAGQRHTVFWTRTMASAAPKDYGAYIDKDLELAPTGSGPLDGLTFAVKDLFDIAGHKTGFGSPAWLDTHEPATHTAPPVQALLAAGARMKGKTHMDELAYSLNGENVHYGTPINPAAPGRIPGGSSSGSAVAVACGDVQIGFGTDTGGSIRVPASFCGLMGIRPTWGRISQEHSSCLARTFTTPGWFARDAATFKAVGSVLLPPESRGPTSLTRWLVCADGFALAEGATTSAIYDAMSEDFEGVTSVLGRPTEVEVASPLADQGLGKFVDWMGVFRVCQGYEVWKAHGEWVTKHNPPFGPGIKDRFQMASKITEEQVEAARKQRALIREHMLALLGSDGVLTLPSTPGPAPLCNTPPAQLDEWRTRLISLTSIAGLAGLPQVSLPLASVDGLPVGLSLIGPPGSDEALLDLSEKLMGVLEARTGAAEAKQ